MQVLTRKSDMLVVGIFGDDERILMEKEMVITPQFNISTVNASTAKLYSNVVKVPVDFGICHYFYNGKMFMKVPK